MTAAPESQPSPIRLVSFIIPAWNEEALLGATLDALLKAAKTLAVPYEIVVADDGSTDKTAEIGRAKGARVVAVSRRQIAATRNAGACAATGDGLIFVDADTLVTPEAVRAALSALQAGAVGGGCAIQFEGRVPAYARVLLPVFSKLYRAAGLAAGCFVFCRRDAFEAIGGFDETLFASEECVLSWALRRHGRFVVLREHVVTSSRKLRTYSGWEILVALWRLTRRGPHSLRDRHDKDIWYGPRRPDPDLPTKPLTS
jgi:glycosyltransferase involved in cell wall biosynthesis